MFTKGNLIFIGFCLTFTACSGENTFKRQSNPTKTYGSVLEGSRPYSAAQHNQEATRMYQDSQKPCGNPFVMSIEGERAKASIFKEEQEKSIIVRVETQLERNTAWDVRAVEGPCQDCLKPISKTANVATFKFTWTPARGAAEKVDGHLLVLRYSWPVEARCSATPITESIALVVKKNDNSPVISFPGLPGEQMKFGDSSKFQIQINDPMSNANQAPDLTIVDSKKDDGVINARKAIDCKKSGRSIETADGQTAWVFDCAFESRLIGGKESEIKALSGSGKVVDAVFTARAVSKASKQISEASPRIRIEFEKISSPVAAAAVVKKTQGDKK